MKYVFIVNPVAGQHKNHSLMEEIEAAFRKANNTEEFVRIDTIAVGDAYTKTITIIERYGTNCTIISCGGDGTLHEIANALVHKDNLLVVLPLGTGNDFAKKIYGPKFKLKEIVEKFGFLTGIPNIQTKKVDMVSIGKDHYINVMSFGFDTKVAIAAKKLADKFRFLGHLSYKLGILFCLFGNKKFKFDIDFNAIDDNDNLFKIKKTLNFTLIAICNASFYGGGFCPAPKSKIDDGILDLCIADCVNIFEVIMLAPRYAKGNVEKHPKVHMNRLISGTISSCDGSPLPGNCDGEIFSESKIEFSVIPKAINLGIYK
ncbi:MAG: diacylglycerol kinase [Clostridiales bacterium]|jgi:YegS/Rv2252/BmrU family lipid kinase|nr:diacylglycerol kinase [Clostridiales bacterium]